MKILYLGNNIKSLNPTTLLQLKAILQKQNNEVEVYSNKSNKLLRLLDMIRAVFKHKSVDYILIDTYSTLNFYYAFICAFLANKLKVKYILILHGGNLPSRLKHSPKMAKRMFGKAHINVAPSGYLFEVFNQKFDTVLIPNAIQIDKYKFKKRVTLQPKILFVRAFAQIYNPQLAIEAFAVIKKKYPEAKLCMIGPNKDQSYEECVSLLQELKLTDSVELTGLLSKEEWHKKSEDFDIFINTTNVDNTPVSVIEAMALGIPVVSTNVGGLPYLIDDKIDGVLVEPGNVEQMVTAIDSLLINGVINMTIDARKKVEKFDIKPVGESWKKIIEQC